MYKGCKKILQNNNINLDTNGYGIIAQNDVNTGYSLKFCFRCVVLDTDEKSFEFEKDDISIKANPKY